MELSIIGAPFDWLGNAPFVKDTPVVQDASGHTFRILRYIGLEASTEPYSGGLTFDPVPLVKDAEVWALRSHFPFTQDAVEDAQREKVIIHGPFTKEPEGVVWMVVKKSSASEALLTDWCDQACEEAITLEAEAYGPSKEDVHAKALSCASISFSLCNAPSKAGLYLAILELAGRDEWAAKTATMLEKNRGFHFLQSVMSVKSQVLTKVYRRRSENLEALLAKVTP